MAPKVIVLALGGTIASAQAASGAVPSLDAGELVTAVPQLRDVAEISAVSFRQVPSPALTIDDVLALGREINTRIEEGVDGVVVTQGTDTLEETAFALDLLVDADTPVVVTGAMRFSGLPGADGPANLLAAVQLAASPAARGLGTTVAFNDEVHAARFVHKSNTSSPSAFRSPLAGPLGWVVEGRPRIAVRPVGRGHVTVPADAGDAPVALLEIALGDDGRLARYLVDAGFAGVVIEGTGGGHVPGVMAAELEDLAGRLPVVLSSRTGSGETLRNTYGLFPGSETDLARRGLISAGALDGIKARILLTLLLMAGAGRDEVREVFEQASLPGPDWSYPGAERAG